MPYLLLVLGCALVALVQGVAPGDVLGWTTVQLALCVVGLMVVRAARGRGQPLALDLALGGAVGTALLLPAWWGQLHLGVPCALTLAVVVVALLAPPTTRRRALDRSAGRLSRGVSPSLSGLVLLVLGWTVGDFTRWTDHWQSTSRTYYPDVLFNLSLTAEAHRALPLTLPQVAGESLPYHWFANVAMAAVGELGRVPDPVVVLQLWYPYVTGLTALALAAAAGEMFSDRSTGSWAAWIAMGWTSIGGATALATAPLTITQNSWASPSMSYALLLMMPALAAIVGQLDGTWRPGPSLALGAGLFAVLTVAKTTVLPVLGVGVGCVLLVAVARRRWRDAARASAWCLLVEAAFLGARGLVYGSSVDGLVVRPFSYVWRSMVGRDAMLADSVPRSVSQAWTSATGVGVLIVLVAVLAVSTVAVVWPGIRRPAGGEAVLAPLLLGGGAAGLGATLLLSHPGTSEVFFLRAAFPLLAMSAAGALAPTWQAASPRLRLRLLVAVAVGAVAWTALTRARLLEQVVVEPWAVLGAVRLGGYAVVVALLALAAWVATRRRDDLLTLAPWAVVLAAGLGTTLGHVVPTERGTVAAAIRADNPNPLRVAELDAAAVLRSTARPEDVVVTNTSCLLPRERIAGHCDARGFWVSALGGHRTLVSGWGYDRRILARGATSTRPYPTLAFWDPPLLRTNLQVIERADPEAVTRVCRSGARWILADAAYGPVSPRLSEVGARLFVADGVQVLRLRCP